METRSNWLMVSVVVGLLTAAALSIVLWFLQARAAEGPTYEIRFERSVEGLQKGSGVDLLGVRVGHVTDLRLQPGNPGLVLVRFALTRDAPLRQGVTASIERSLLDGSATIRLEGGGDRGPLLAAGPGQPFAVVPVKSGGAIGGDLDPTTFIARMSSISGSLSQELGPSGQRNIEQRLGELSRRSEAWEGEVGRIAGRIAQPERIRAFRRPIAEAADEAERIGRGLAPAAGGIPDKLARPLDKAQRTAESLERSISRARPRIRRLEKDAREAAETLRSLRNPIRQAGDVAEKIEREGLRSNELPDYHPPASETR